MSTAPQAKDPRGTEHFLPVVCEAACGCFFTAWHDIHGTYWEKPTLPEMRHGPYLDAALEKAYDDFRGREMRHDQLIKQNRGMTKQAFGHVLRDHWASYVESRSCPRKSRRLEVNLTQAETEELARIIATPAKDEAGQLRHFDSIDKALIGSPSKARLQKLIRKSGASIPVLHDHLLKNVTQLKFAAEDVVPKLTPTTRDQRKECAKVLRGEKPWLKAKQIPRMHATRVAKPISVTPPPPAEPYRIQKLDEDVKWDGGWWGPHTFMADATHFSNQEGAPLKGGPDVYTLVDICYPPREVKAGRPISQTTSIMVYVVIHKYLGLIVGPDIMFTGTKLPQRSTTRKSEEQLFAEAGVKTWYARILCINKSACAWPWACLTRLSHAGGQR